MFGGGGNEKKIPKNQTNNKPPATSALTTALVISAGAECPNVFLFSHYHSGNTESEQQLHCCFPAIFTEITSLKFSSHALILYIQPQIFLYANI